MGGIGVIGAQGVAKRIWGLETQYRRIRRLAGDQGFERHFEGPKIRWWAGDRGLEVEARCPGRRQGVKVYKWGFGFFVIGLRQRL